MNDPDPKQLDVIRQYSMDLEYAKLFAAEKHREQTYGQGLPYTVHLRDVEQTLRRFGCTDAEMLCAAWLHDVVEDTPTSVQDIQTLFGDRVSRLVHAVTNEPGVNRAERHAKTYGKIKANNDYLFLKLADRISNVESCIREKDSRLKMYKKEWAGFKQELYTPGVHEEMWTHLTSLLER